MKKELFRIALDLINEAKHSDRNVPVGSPAKLKRAKVSNRGFHYAERHTGQWTKPEYSLDDIQIAQDTDSYVFKSIQLKSNRFALAGWEFTSLNSDRLSYVKGRIQEIEGVSGMPFSLLLYQTARDLIRYSNCVWVKVRKAEASSGLKRTLPSGKEADPVAGYFILPFETLQFKHKVNGELSKVMQKMPASSRSREFAPEDVVHFYTNRNPGFAMGTPELGPVLEDVLLLRRVEELVEDLLQTSIFPVWQWSVGSDTLPERVGPDGVKESDLVKKAIEYMPAGGIFVTDHRHDIKAVGAEGRALRIEGYLDYFKKRVFAGLGVSGVDMGEGDTSNKATATAISKRAIQDVEALHLYVKLFIDYFVINELLLEGGFGREVFSDHNRVEIKFGAVDNEDQSRLENQAIQLYVNKLMTEKEARKRLRLNPMSDEDRANTYWSLYEEPAMLVKSLGNAAADQALVESTTSSISKEGVEKGGEARSPSLGRPPAPLPTGSQRQSLSRARPSNQHGQRSAPKFGDGSEQEVQTYVDIFNLWTEEINLCALDNSFDDGLESVGTSYLRDCNTSVLGKKCLGEKLENRNRYLGEVREMLDYFIEKANEFKSSGASVSQVASSMNWRFDYLIKKYIKNSFQAGIRIGRLEKPKD